MNIKKQLLPSRDVNAKSCPYCHTKLPEHQRHNFIGITRCQVCNRSYSIYYAKGKEFMSVGNYDAAVQHFIKALKNFKSTTQIYIDLAVAFNHLIIQDSENQNELLIRRNEAIKRAIEIGYDNISLDSLLKIVKMS